MSESVVGFSVAATRQNAARFAYAFVVSSARVGGANFPGATIWEEVIVVFGKMSAVRASHDVAAADVAAASVRAGVSSTIAADAAIRKTAIRRMTIRSFITLPLGCRPLYHLNYAHFFDLNPV